MTIRVRVLALSSILAGTVTLFAYGCGSSSGNPSASEDDGIGSEIATSTVGGAVSGGGTSNVAMNMPVEHSRGIDWSLIPDAEALTISCTGGGINGMSPHPFSTSTSTYTYTPASCTVDYLTGKTASVIWTPSGEGWTFKYSSTCTAFLPANQTGTGCTITRTSPTGGLTRTATGPKGNSDTVTYDTSGTNTGYDSSTYPTTSAGAIQTCTSVSECLARTLVLSGSHLTGTVEDLEGDSAKWDHTVSTSSSGVTITGTGTNTVVTGGSVIVQHNLAQFTTTSTFANAAFSDASCCFPESGSVTTTFSGGPNDGKSESLAFTSTCGQATLTTAGGATVAVTLSHCL